MDCCQTLPGAVNSGPCSVATGYLEDIPFICYASGSNLILLNGNLKHVQTLLGANFGYGQAAVTCMHVADFSGKVVAAWDRDVMIFQPDQADIDLPDTFSWTWKPVSVHSFTSKVLSLSFNQNGTQLLVGGSFISLWKQSSTDRLSPQLREASNTLPSFTVGGKSGLEVHNKDSGWSEYWNVSMSSPVVHLKFSSDGSMFASASMNDRLVKIWYKVCQRKEKLISHSHQKVASTSFSKYSFTYVAHPRAITGFVWRKTSAYMKQDAVANVLLTRCKDNICRFWSHVLNKEKAPQTNLLHFFLAASIDPVADIPFRSTMPVEDADFIVHWLNNKEMTFTSKANHIYQSKLSASRSMTSINSSVNEEILSSWVCVEEKLSDYEGDENVKYQSYSLGDYIKMPSPQASNSALTTPMGDSFMRLNKKNENQLIEEWINSPDLLVCIHPNNGSLMVWTVEGLDPPRHSTRLVHVSFSSCLPHVFPPHLAQTLHQELQQYLLKDPEPIGVLSSPLSPPPTSPKVSSPLNSMYNTSELSLPVPQIRLPSGQKVVDVPESSKTFRPESSLVLLSSHRNGSLNAWSVELTVQSNYCTSISGLIHCGQTGGHSKDVQCVYRHPWLPIVMTVANKGANSLAENELIIWNANIAGPLDHKAQVNELSRISSPEINSFTVACWMPPICFKSDDNANALSRCPSFGLFVTNIGNELCLFQTSLYPIIPPNSRHTLYHSSRPLHESSSQTILVTSHSGTDGVAVIGLIDDDIAKFEDIVSIHAFRMDSTFRSTGFDSSDEILIALIENRHRTVSSSYSVQSYIHVWRVILQETKYTQTFNVTDSLDPWYQPQSTPTILCHSAITKLLSGEKFPMEGPNVYVLQSKSACDVASSLQLQLPSLSSPYLFTTISSDGTVNCWQFQVKQLDSEDDSFSKPPLQLQLYDVFGTENSLNCFSSKHLDIASVTSNLPVALCCAYPGRFAIAHSLKKPLKKSDSVDNPLAKHMMVSIWESESSGGINWVCESLLSLNGVGGVTSSSEKVVETLHLDWLPMENGSYLLAVCFISTISIFGMAQPSLESQLDVSSNVFEKASSKWVCLLDFSLNRPYIGCPIHWFAYTGSNSLMVGIGCEIEIYTCWLETAKMKSLLSDKVKNSHLNVASNQNGINLLDYAHSWNSPLPQYHPQILTDLLAIGKLEAVKLILVNLTKYLLLYQKEANSDEYISFDERVKMEDETDSQSQLLTIVNGHLKRKQGATDIVQVENIAPLSLSQLKIFSSDEKNDDVNDEVTKKEDDDDFDALFSHDYSSLSYDSNLMEMENDAITFDEVKLFASQFTPKLADKLESILRYCQLPGINAVEHVRLITIANTAAKTEVSFSETPAYSNVSMHTSEPLPSIGAGYAAIGFHSRTEAIDDCGLRYLLALQNYLSLSVSLPKDIAPSGVATSDIIWAFHSDAETELLSHIPCVQNDSLNWPDLKAAGVGWWARSSGTLKKLIEQLAKAQFMAKQDPLDACLFYLAMKKQSLIKGLFKTVNNEKMRQFFSNDFTQDRWRKAALKNAFALLSKQRFEHAAAFFLLGGKLWDAVDVCICRLNDIQLAIVLTRLFEGDDGPCYKRILKECILGILPGSSQEPSHDPFLRTMALWLLQDYSGALETLLVNLSSDSALGLNPSIFNFYFYLRSHPLILRSKYPSKTVSNEISTFHHSKNISGVGNEPFTSSEQALVFNTAYYYLSNGSPILTLTVLSKLPKVNHIDEVNLCSSPPLEHSAGEGQESKLSDATTDFDWSMPVSQQNTSFLQSEDDFDWSQPVASQIKDTMDIDSLSLSTSGNNEIVSTNEETTIVHGPSQQNVFVHSLAEQLQYNALLSILTEELALIHLSACYEYIWNTNGNVISSKKGIAHQSMTEWFEGEPLEHVLTTIQRKIVHWLRNESLVVKEVCGIEIGVGSSAVMSSNRTPHAGYDLLTTLLNYVSLHASTFPNMLAVQTELLHLMNTLLPWNTGLSNELEDSDLQTGQTASCAINPVQVPLLSSCSLPIRHPLNMALNIRLMSSSIFSNLSLHATPPTLSNPLEHIDQIFDLCCALSHSLYLCLNPMRLSQETISVANTSNIGSATRKRVESGGNMLDILSSLDSPNTKPSKWPGLEEWPQSLLSDDGKEASPLCLVLMEAFVVVYCGLLSVAWSKHSIYDILILVANSPTSKKWKELFGGGAIIELRDQKKSASIARRVSSIKKLLKQSESKDGSAGSIGLYVAPKESLLKYFLTKPLHSKFFQFEEDSDDDNSFERESLQKGYSDVSDPNDPDCYSWCLMNLGIVQLIQKVIRSTVSLTGMEVLEFITASPVLYRLLGLLEDWETAFAHQLDKKVSSCIDLLFPGEDNQEATYGPALMRHKFILEPEHSPFRNEDKSSKLARKLWSYLVHQENVRETFIRYIFYKKRIGTALTDEPQVQRILYRQPDTPVSCLCINSSNYSVFALATSKEVLEIEVPDIMSLDVLIDVDDPASDSSSSKRNSFARSPLENDGDDYIMIPSGASTMHRHQFLSPGHVTYSQSGCTSSILLKRNISSVKRMAAHPSLAYYLTGSADGSIKMFEFGTPKPVSVLRQAGAGLGITQIKFTPQGNKYGVTDSSGKLSLWQGIQGYNKEPYQVLNPANTQRTIADFAFLGSSSLIATCGDSSNNKNICIWDTLMPTKSNIVTEFACHEGGASAVVFSSSKQRLISGGRKGEIYIYDIRSRAVVSNPVVHSAAITCIVINDTDGYFITGSADGEIKVWDTSTVCELTSIQGRHTRSRLFRSDEGVMDMVVDSSGCLYSCGADGTVKVHTLDLS